MTRVVSLYLPTWPTDRRRRTIGSSPDGGALPLALIGRDGRKRVVVAADALAQQLGVTKGMAASMAQALVAGLAVEDADAAADDAALGRLALWALRQYSPVVATDPTDGLMIEVTGATHLRGGEAAMLTDLVSRLRTAGIAARAGVAGTYGTAHALARFGPGAVTLDSGDDMLVRLPVAALRLPSVTVDTLRRLGFGRIGELAATPRAPLALRFGSEVGRRLDQMFGRVSEPFDLVDAPDLIRVMQAFAEPVAAAETIARAIAGLVDRLCAALEETGLGARTLDLLFHRVDDALQAIRVGTAKPVRDRKRLTRLLCDRIEKVSPGFGIETMTLSAPLAEPLDYRATASSLIDAKTPDISELIDVLGNRVGAERIYRVAAEPSDVPERSIRRVAPLAATDGTSWPGEWPRPSRLFSPERVETVALLPDHPPAAFTWRGIRRRVRRADGPERVFGEWWKRDAESAAVRDYFQSRTTSANGSGCFAPATARTRIPVRKIGSSTASSARLRVVAYAELQCASHFSFLRGASSAEELFAQAAGCGHHALAITDRNSLAGIVRAHEAAKVTGVRLIVGCRLILVDGTDLLVYPTDRPAYARLCRLLSLGKGRAGKASCELHWADVAEWSEGLIAVLVPDAADDAAALRLRRLRQTFGDRAYLALTLRRRPRDHLRLNELINLAAAAGVLTVAANDVLFHHPDRRILQDIVTCIREGVVIDDVGFRRERHADRYLKPPEEMARLFRLWPDAVARSVEIADRCRFSLDELTYQYPHEVGIEGLSSQSALEKLTFEGAATRYPEGLPDDVAKTLRHELTLIASLDYAPYFLTVNSIVAFARSRGILCQGRGSAANSAVCFVLGITSIDPGRNDLLFERFVSQERKEPPDIDVDFEHERREEVIQWVYDTYGRTRAAMCSTVIRYRAKGALRDVGKTLGLPEDMIKLLSSQVWGWSTEGVEPKHAEELNLNLSDRRLRLAMDLARQLIGAPRHLSQHPGGFVLTEDRLDELVPIEPAAMDDRQVIEWDKDDIDALKFMKVDVLALGMLSCMRRGFDLLRDYKGIDLDLATIPAEDPRTYAMIRKADTLGTFQIESRAQMAMLPRIKPRTFYDLVIEVAIVRPGPIQGDMVHPYLRRREGLEPVDYPTPELERVLGKTLHVPLFQEQAMRVAIECAGFTPGEADQLRRAMATFKFTGRVSHFQTKLIEGMKAKGYTEEFATKIFSQLEGFGSYGFPESHAASFALIAYASSWLKCWHPDVFCAALLNAQPMGFYATAQIVRDAQEHGVEVRPICVNASRWDCTLEALDDERFAVRLGLRIVRGLHNTDAAAIVAARADRPFADVDDVWRRADAKVSALERLAEADAFRDSRGLARREASWAIKALRDEPLPLFAAAARHDERPPPEIVEDYRQVGLSLRDHPVSFLRADLTARGIATCRAATAQRDGRRARLAGLVLVRQKPGSAKGVMFITLEDETAIANLVIWPSLYEKQRRLILTASMMGVEGSIQREGDVVHVVVRKLHDLSGELASLGERDAVFPLPHGRGDEFHHGSTPDARDRPPPVKTCDIYIPDLHIDTLKVKAREFR